MSAEKDKAVERIIKEDILWLGNEIDELLWKTDIDAYMDAWHNRGPDPEVLQTWIVTEWLVQKLYDIGEPVAIDYYGLHFWGRTCCGQAIEADGTIQEVVDLIM